MYEQGESIKYTYICPNSTAGHFETSSTHSLEIRKGHPFSTFSIPMSLSFLRTVSLHTQYATSGAYCVGSIHMLFQWSSEGTQYALLENMSRGMFAFLSNCPLEIHLSILRTLCLKPCPHHNCIIVVFNPHQQHFGDIVSKFGFFPDMKSTFGNRSKEKWGNAGG